MHNRRAVSIVPFEVDGERVILATGCKVPPELPEFIVDGVYIGAEVVLVVFGGVLVAAWKGISHVVPHGTPHDWDKLAGKYTHIDKLAAHITIDSLKEGAKREHLDWEEDCVPNMTELLKNLSLEIEPIHLCMMACNKLRRKIKE